MFVLNNDKKLFITLIVILNINVNLYSECCTACRSGKNKCIYESIWYSRRRKREKFIMPSHKIHIKIAQDLNKELKIKKISM